MDGNQDTQDQGQQAQAAPEATATASAQSAPEAQTTEAQNTGAPVVDAAQSTQTDAADSAGKQVDAPVATAQAAPAQGTVDNYELPTGKPMAGLQFVEGSEQKAEESAAPEAEATASAEEIHAVLDSCLTESTQAGTIKHELNFAINHVKTDLEGRWEQFKYRIGCLAADASEEEHKIIAKIKALF